jgi:hypothetical protein
MVNLATTQSVAAVPSLPTDKSAGNLELVALFEDADRCGGIQARANFHQLPAAG